MTTTFECFHTELVKASFSFFGDYLVNMYFLQKKIVIVFFSSFFKKWFFFLFFNIVAYEHHSSSPKNLREIWKDKGKKVINVLCISCTYVRKDTFIIYVQESYRNSLIFTKSVSSCMFLTLCVCLRNTQELTDFQNAGKVEKKWIPVCFSKS